MACGCQKKTSPEQRMVEDARRAERIEAQKLRREEKVRAREEARSLRVAARTARLVQGR